MQENSEQKGPPPAKTSTTADRLQAPVRTHVYVWIFMITLGVSPLLYSLGTREYLETRNWPGACIAVVLIQVLFWIAQRRCSSEDLTYWEGLLVVAAAVETGSYLISLPLAFLMLSFTFAASLFFALLHDPRSAARHAPLCFGRMIVAIHRRRLYR